MKEREKGDQRERQCIPEDEGTKNFIHHKNLDQQTQGQADQDNTTWPPYGFKRSIQKELQ